MCPAGLIGDAHGIKSGNEGQDAFCVFCFVDDSVRLCIHIVVWGRGRRTQFLVRTVVLRDDETFRG
jgi:hypothetical protein